MTSTVEDWQKQIAGTFLAGVGFAADERVRKFLVKRGLTVSGIGLVAVGSRFAVEGAGLGASYAIAGKEGMKDWQRASATMYDWGYLSHIPIVGQVASLVPNPIGVGKVLFESGKMIGEHTQDMPRNLYYTVKAVSQMVVDWQRRQFPGFYW